MSVFSRALAAKTEQMTLNQLIPVIPTKEVCAQSTTWFMHHEKIVLVIGCGAIALPGINCTSRMFVEKDVEVVHRSHDPVMV